MNKTISINLSGMLFNLEEGAYEKLGRYLQQLKRSFASTEGADEILADIEQRIAELFAEKLKSKQVILEQEVDEVIAQLGAPEDYETEPADEPQRPKAQREFENEDKERRLFRDPDHAVIGGVCSGVGYYFGIDPIWLRLAFVVALFFAGTGPLLYIILWIVIPKAGSTAEKLQMRGERVNIENIERRIKEEADRFKHRAGEFGEKARRDLSNANLGSRIGGFVNEFVQAVLQFMRGVVKFMGRSLGVFFLFLGGIFLFVYLSSVFSSGTMFSFSEIEGVSSFSVTEFLSAFFSSNSHRDLFIIGVALVILTPILGLILLGIRLVTYPQVKLGWAVPINGMLFIAGLLMCVIIGSMLITDFTARGKRLDAIALNDLSSDTLTIAIQPNSDINLRQYLRASLWRFYFNDGEQFITGDVRINVKASETQEFGIEVERFARGEDKKRAIENAQNTKYFVRQEDHVVFLNSYFSLPDDAKWRRQRLEFNVLVPQGKFLRFRSETADILNDIPNEQNIEDTEMVDKVWQMGANGLTCVSCPKEESEDLF